jgi:dynein heavy chain 1, cytosolic
LLNKTVTKHTFDEGDPLSRYFASEHRTAYSLLRMVLGDLTAAKDVLEGSDAYSNKTRKLVKTLSKAELPRDWAIYDTPLLCTPAQFIGDLKMRLNQAKALIDDKQLREAKIWTGGLFDPFAFMTATRQIAAIELGVSLERLALNCYLAEPKAKKGVFVLQNLRLHGAKWTDSSMQVVEQVTSTTLGMAYLCWSEVEPDTSATRIPVFLTEDRDKILFYCQVPSTGQSCKNDIIKRSVALFA